MKRYVVEITYVVPKTGVIYHDVVGPVFGKKATNDMAIIYARKRNVMVVKTEEVTDDN